MVYLGSLLSSDGKIISKINRRLGMARKDFGVLQSIWKHTSLSQAWKVRIFEACILSKLVYGLVTAILNKLERRRLGGFQARCIRRILKVPPSYYNRVSSARVLAVAGKEQLSNLLVRQQMTLMGKIAFRPNDDVVRKSIFLPNNVSLRPLPGPAKRVRPRTRWLVHILGLCVRIAGSYERLLNYWHLDNSSFAAWKSHVRRTVLN